MSATSENLEFDESTNTLLVGEVEGVIYKIGGREISGEVQLDKTTVVRAYPAPGFVFPKGVDREFRFEVKKDQGENVKSEEKKPVEAEKPAPVDTPANTAGTTPQSPGQDAAQADARTGTNTRP